MRKLNKNWQNWLTIVIYNTRRMLKAFSFFLMMRQHDFKRRRRFWKRKHHTNEYGWFIWFTFQDTLFNLLLAHFFSQICCNNQQKNTSYISYIMKLQFMLSFFCLWWLSVSCSFGSLLLILLFYICCCCC